MKAIYAGTISGGFSLKAVVDDDEEQLAITKVSKENEGNYVESLDIQEPLSLLSMVKGVDENGIFFVAFSGSPSSGISIYGPFKSPEKAESFGEAGRSDDDDYVIEEHDWHTKDRFTEILQHRIKWWLRGFGAPEELGDSSVEHLEKMIKQGYHSGELCEVGEDNETEYHGWWEITKD